MRNIVIMSLEHKYLRLRGLDMPEMPSFPSKHTGRMVELLDGVCKDKDSRVDFPMAALAEMLVELEQEAAGRR